MTPALGLALLVAGVLAAARWAPAARLMRWLPTPLWCYGLPMLVVAAGWLPAEDPAYTRFTSLLLPVALACLLFSVDLSSVRRTGAPALAAMGLGAASIILGVPLAAWLWRAQMPAEAWTGVGALAGTWTGGSMNLLALRAMLQTPEQIFTALILVDALIAYGWMSLLVALSPHEPVINRWLRATPAVPPAPVAAPPLTLRASVIDMTIGLGAAIALAAVSAAVAPRLPTGPLITSAGGWTIALVTTGALAASGWPALRRLGRHTLPLGMLGLYLVLAALGTQARLGALWSAPVWLLVGVSVAAIHGVVMALGGRLMRLPLGVLATASQANFGGVVSAPLVAAVYHPGLMPVGLCLAIAGNALGTYAGLGAAWLARVLLGG